MQVDEPALREGLPLKQERWQSYLDWAVKSFRLATAVAQNHTQVVTHLCYSEFADILEVIFSLHLPTVESTHVSSYQLLPCKLGVQESESFDSAVTLQAWRSRE